MRTPFDSRLFFLVSADLYRMTGDTQREQDGLQMHTNYSQQLLKDHFNATHLQEHALIQWTDGRFPPLPDRSGADASAGAAASSSSSSAAAGASSSSSAPEQSTSHYEQQRH